MIKVNAKKYFNSKDNFIENSIKVITIKKLK